MFPRSLTPDCCSRCGRPDLFWECFFCREAGLVRAVWQVVLLQVAPTGGYAAADVADRVLQFCGSPCFEHRVERMSTFLRGPPWTNSPFCQMDRECDDVLCQDLPIPRPRRPLCAGHRLGGFHTGRPGHRGNDSCYFGLSRHIAGFLVPRGLRTRCSCQSVQKLVPGDSWSRCSSCNNAVMLDICHSPVVDRARLPSRDDDDVGRHRDTDQILTDPRSSWEHW
jgi:hypothetical protein